jgi:Zinc binding domain
MTNSCCPERPVEPTTTRCPHSGSAGKAVDRQTVKALLTEPALQRLTAGAYRFCPDAACDVVYFSGDGGRFATADVRVDVWQKRPFGNRQICYCFGESEASMRAEMAATGRSSAVERIREHIAAGRCACEIRNPRGVCCVGDVIAAVKGVESRGANDVSVTATVARSTDVR